MSEADKKKPPRRVLATSKSGEPKKGIYIRPDGKYEIGWRDAHGRKRWRVVQGGLKEAEKLRTAEIHKRDKGERSPDSRLTFQKAAQEWQDHWSSELRPRTQEIYKIALGHINKSEHFRASLHKITKKNLTLYIKEKQAQGLMGWTIRGHLTVISAVFKFAAAELGAGVSNPVAMLPRGSRPSIQDARDKRILSRDELGRLIAAADDAYRLIFEVAAETGARLGEVLGLHWKDVDINARMISFNYQLDRHGERVALKTEQSKRVIGITPALAARLRQAKMVAARSADYDFVFVSRAGTPHDHRNVGGRVLGRAVKRAGLQAITDAQGRVVQPAPTFHDLRHSHASALIARGEDIASVSARLGHADVATTLRIYTHQFEAAKRSAERDERLADISPVEPLMEPADGSNGDQAGDDLPANVVQLQADSGI